MEKICRSGAGRRHNERVLVPHAVVSWHVEGWARVTVDPSAVTEDFISM